MNSLVKIAALFVLSVALFAVPTWGVATPGLYTHIWAGHMEPSPTSTPGTFDIYGMNSGNGNTSILSFTWCTGGGANCGSAVGAPPAITSVKGYSTTDTTTLVCTFTAGPQESNNTDFLYSTLYRCPGTSQGGGIIHIRVIFASATIQDFQYAYAEYFNLADIDGTCTNASLSSGPTVTAGACTPSQAGDLYYQYCMQTSNGMGSGNTQTSISGSGITFDATDFSFGGAAGREINAGTGSLSLSFTMTGITQNINCIMAAFKASASSTGTPPSGMYVAHQQWNAGTRAATMTNFFPTVGNLVVVETSAASNQITAASDTTNGNYTLISNTGFPSYAYFPNAASGLLHISVTIGTSGRFYRLLDIVGAATSPIDTGRTCASPSSAAGTGACKNTGTSVPPWNDAPDITPSAAGIVIVTNAVGTGPNGVPTSPSNPTFLCTTYTGETDAENFCRGDGYAILPSTATAEAWSWPNSNGSTSTSFNAVAVSFLAPAAAAGNTYEDDSFGLPLGAHDPDWVVSIWGLVLGLSLSTVVLCPTWRERAHKELFVNVPFYSARELVRNVHPTDAKRASKLASGQGGAEN